MARKRYTVEQIITKLREAEVEMAKGATTVEVCRKLGISEQTYYRWRKASGVDPDDGSRGSRDGLVGVSFSESEGHVRALQSAPPR